jgi:UPF0755 protein
MKKTLFVVLSLLLVSAFGLRNSVQQFLQQPLLLTGPYLEIKAGSSLRQLCSEWQQQQLLSAGDCTFLKFLSVLKPELRDIKAGVYAVSSMPLNAQLALFRSGKVAQFSLLLREGWTLKQNLQSIINAPFLINDVSDDTQVASMWQWPQGWGKSPINGEGLILPDTYFYTANTKASTIISRAHKSLLAAVDTAWQQRNPDIPLASPYELLILASIIEKETGFLPEKPLISSVFINRLRQGMRLQTDPTVIYGLGDRYRGDITRAHLRDPHIYNTYVHAGLPPGPIALVSKTSLQAAAQPEISDKLFFVAKGDGRHQFSASLQQHNQAVQQYIFGKKP